MWRRKAGGSSLAVASLLVLALARQAIAQQSCTNVPGFKFYRLQDAIGAEIRKSASAGSALSAQTVQTFAAECSAQTLCNAFTTWGVLKVVTTSPQFEVLDVSDAAAYDSCDGVYVASARNPVALAYPASVSRPDNAAQAQQGAQRMAAIAAAAKRVSDAMRASGSDPRKARNMSPQDVRKAFDAAKVPLAVSSPSLSYTLSDVVSAVVSAAWDSRLSNATGSGTYNFISPVKDQGGCGSCVTFATVSVAETSAAIGSKLAGPNTFDLSEQWLWYCNGMISWSCASGSWPGDSEKVVVSKNLPFDVNYPYKDSAADCTLYSPPEKRTAGTYSSVYFTASTITQAKQHIRDWGSVMTYFDVYDDFYWWRPAQGPYVYNGVSDFLGGHAVAASTTPAATGLPRTAGAPDGATPASSRLPTASAAS